MLEEFVIKGGLPLKGEVSISGAKNSALPIFCASLLTDKKLELTNVPFLSDIKFMGKLLEEIGCEVSFNNDQCTIKAFKIKSEKAPYDIVRKMRASFLVLGPLLARHGKAKVSLPGGCAIGPRPTDIHIMGISKMGAKVQIENGYVIAEGKLKGAEIDLPFPSVGATENIMMAATLAKGRTIINNAAREPEIVDLANCLIKMGAKIKGAGTKTIIIDGVNSLNGAKYRIMEDRLETVTYAIISLLTGSNLLLLNTHKKWIKPLLDCLPNLKCLELGNAICLKGSYQTPINIETNPWPGFSTDLQAQMTVLMTQVSGISSISENIFENRFMHIPELNRMGANIKVKGKKAVICGKNQLKGAHVMATDLRASVSLVLAALCAKGETVVSRIYHLHRGYYKLEENLQKCGAQISRRRQAA